MDIFSESIPINKGVHQGGCCSSIYFLVIAEILALSLRSNENIEGITIQDIRNILNQFADDMDIFSLAKERSIKAILSELESFRLHSGFTVSYDKTTLYRIGSLRHSNAAMYDIDQYNWSNKDITVLGVTISHEDIVSKNYDVILEKVKKTLSLWYNRSLSLIGKVQVVNALVASQLVYKMMVLPTLPIRYVKSIDSLIRDYIWGGKKAKIAYKNLQNSKEEGGLNLVNLVLKDKSLKATWHQILVSEKDYATTVYKIMGKVILDEDIWRCTLLPEDVKYLKIRVQFWEDVLKSWSSFNYYKNCRPETQLLWYNSHIRVQNKPFFWADAYKNGLKYVYQLFSSCEWKSEKAIYDEFKLSVLRYNGIKKAIPGEWRDFFLTAQPSQYHPLCPTTYDMYKEVTNLSRIVYKYLQGDISYLQNKLVAWHVELGQDIQDNIYEYGRLHFDVFRVTNVTKYRSFQYRLLQRGLVTNIQLMKWRILPSDSCTFCSVERETISHLLFHCCKTQQLWTQVNQYLSKHFECDLKFDVIAVLSNRMVEHKNHVVNFLCLVTKQYIYRQRCFKKELSFVQLEKIIKRIECIEKYIAIKNGKFQLHLRKWKCMDRNECTNYILDYVDLM